MKLNGAAKHKHMQSKKMEIKAEKLALQQKLAAKFGDRFKAVKKKDDTVVISKEAALRAEEAKDSSSIKSDDPNSEKTKDKLKGLMRTGDFKFNDKEREALEEILG
jgi:hypothetical protein